MPNVAVRIAADIPEPLRGAVEQLLGRPVLADEEISIVATARIVASPSKSRAEMAGQLTTLLDLRAAKVESIPDDLLDSVIDEAIEVTRRKPR